MRRHEWELNLCFANQSSSACRLTWLPPLCSWGIWVCVWSSSSQTRHQHLFLIVPPTPGISLWITTRMAFYCLLAYPVLRKGPSLNLRGEVWTLRHYMICVNTWMIIFGLSDARIFPSWVTWHLGVNGLSPQSRTPPMSLSVCEHFSVQNQMSVDQNIVPCLFTLSHITFFFTPRCIVRTVRHLVWW